MVQSYVKFLQTYYNRIQLECKNLDFCLYYYGFKSQKVLILIYNTVFNSKRLATYIFSQVIQGFPQRCVEKHFFVHVFKSALSQ